MVSLSPTSHGIIESRPRRNSEFRKSQMCKGLLVNLPIIALEENIVFITLECKKKFFFWREGRFYNFRMPARRERVSIISILVGKQICYLQILNHVDMSWRVIYQHIYFPWQLYSFQNHFNCKCEKHRKVQWMTNEKIRLIL